MLSHDIQKNIFHAFGVGPLFIYIGIYRETLPDSIFKLLFVLGAIILCYHSYRAFLKLKENKSAWVNWIHIFLVAPLLFIVGYLKKDANRRYFEMLLLLGFSAIGYHSLYLIRDTIME